MNTGTVLKPLSAEEVAEFHAGLIQQVPRELYEHPEAVRRYNRSKKKLLGKLLREALLAKLDGLNLDQHLELWQRVYWEICGVEPRLQDIELPDDPGGFGWPIVTTPEVGLNAFFAGLKRKLDCHSYYGDDLEKSLDWARQERNYRNGAYAIRVHDVVEADEKLKNLSANTIAERGIRTMTLDERIRLEGFYWTLSNGKHLDVKNVTLCSGSRRSGGSVPGVDWSAGDRRLCVGLYRPGYSYGNLRARAVSSPAQA